MSSTSVIMVPARLLPLVRSGAQVQAGRAAEAFSYSSERLGREDRSEWFLEPRRLMDSHTELLDVVGWVERRPEQDILLDLDSHGEALATALEGQLEIERYQHAGSTRTARRRARRNMRSIKRFLDATGLALRPPRGVRAERWMRHGMQALVAYTKRPYAALYGQRRIPVDPETAQRTVLDLLLGGKSALRPGQLARHTGGRRRAREAIAALRQAGLVSTSGARVCLTSAAEMFHRLEQL